MASTYKYNILIAVLLVLPHQGMLTQSGRHLFYKPFSLTIVYWAEFMIDHGCLSIQKWIIYTHFYSDLDTGSLSSFTGQRTRGGSLDRGYLCVKCDLLMFTNLWILHMDFYSHIVSIFVHLFTVANLCLWWCSCLHKASSEVELFQADHITSHHIIYPS